MQARLEALAPATAQKNINLNTLHQVAIALPPRDEQVEIVNAVDKQLSKERHIARTTNASIRRLSMLHQAILKRAFEGNLLSAETKTAAAG